MSRRSESADNLVAKRIDEEEILEDEEEDVDEWSLEEVFKDYPVPPWSQQITFRAIFTGGVLSFVFNVINCKLNLTTGVVPYLNVAAALLGYFYMSLYSKILHSCGLLKQPFTRQENTVIQTCVVASSGVAFSSGTASYLLGMSPIIASQTDGGNTPINVKQLSLAWMYPYLFAVSFVGLFSIVPLRKIMILKYKLPYPTGTATAYLINSFHTPRGAKQATKQVAALFKAFGGSFAWAAFQWFFASHENCGFNYFPTFGLKAFQQRFYFDFSSTYVGVGMICPYMVNISLLVGAIISWGIVWPLIEQKKGIWYDAELQDYDFHGMQGYRVFLAIATIFGDGFFHVVYMAIVMVISFMKQISNNNNAANASSSSEIPHNYTHFSDEDSDHSYDDKRRTEYFLKDQIPDWFAAGGYIVLVVLSIIVVPIIFNQRLKWYHILVAYIIAPVLAFCNAYGCGLTDLSLASNYGKIAILIFSAWIGDQNGGVIAGLAACGLTMNIVSTASDLMQDFKTGYMTLSSPRSMFISQVIGTAMGCVITPTVFWFFYKAYNVGDPAGSYPAPYGQMYRAIAVIGVEGLSALPRHCLQLAILCFCGSIILDTISMALKKFETRYGIYRFIPSPMCMAIPFYLGGYFAIDMCVGSLILFVWKTKDKRKAEAYAPAVASGLICGDSLWGVPAALLQLAKVKAPICMAFLSNTQYAQVIDIIGDYYY